MDLQRFGLSSHLVYNFMPQGVELWGNFYERSRKSLFIMLFNKRPVANFASRVPQPHLWNTRRACPSRSLDVEASRFYLLEMKRLLWDPLPFHTSTLAPRLACRSQPSCLRPRSAQLAVSFPMIYRISAVYGIKFALRTLSSLFRHNEGFQLSLRHVTYVVLLGANQMLPRVETAREGEWRRYIIWKVYKITINSGTKSNIPSFVCSSRESLVLAEAVS